MITIEKFENLEKVVLKAFNEVTVLKTDNVTLEKLNETLKTECNHFKQRLKEKESEFNELKDELQELVGEIKKTKKLDNAADKKIDSLYDKLENHYDIKKTDETANKKEEIDDKPDDDVVITIDDEENKKNTEIKIEDQVFSGDKIEKKTEVLNLKKEDTYSDDDVGEIIFIDDE